MAFDWGSAIGAGVSLINGYMGSKSAKDAAKESGKASDAQIALSRDIYNDQRNLQMPFYQGGLQAFDQYRAMLGLGGSASALGGGAFSPQGSMVGPAQWFGSDKGAPTVNSQLYGSDPYYRKAWDEVSAYHGNRPYVSGSSRDALQQHMQTVYNQARTQGQQQNPAMTQQQAFAQFRNTPGYQFGLDEGRNTVEASAAARGGLNSGATLKALQKFGNDYADQQGYTPYMNRLAGLFGGAQTASNSIGQFGSNYGQQAGQAMQNAGNARANSTYASGQAWGDAMNNAAYFTNKLGTNQGWWG